MNTPLQSATRDHIAAAVAEIITAAVAEIAENTAVIDQAKGMLILLYGVDDQTAFDILRRHSQNTNIELRALAEQLVFNYRALSNGDGNPWSLEQSSIPVDQDLLCGLLGSGGVVGPFDEFAVLELRAGADERHEMGRVDRPPA